MTIFVLSIGALAILMGLVMAFIQQERVIRQKTEDSIVKFWRDHEQECRLWLSQKAIRMIKKEMNNAEHGFDK
jgi:uncharacterized protein with PQ loop repeat